MQSETASQSVAETSDAQDVVTSAPYDSDLYFVESGGAFNGELTSGDRDVIGLTVEAGVEYTITISTPEADGIRDSYLTLYDADTSRVTYNDDINYQGGNYLSEVTFTASYSGTYYIETTTYDTAANRSNVVEDTGSYTLSVSDTGPAGELRVFTNDEIATQVNESYWNGRQYAWDVSPGDSLDVNISALTTDGQSLARNALEAWELVLGITFTETTSSQADITFDDDQSGAYASFNSFGGTITSANVNVSATWLDFYAVGGDRAALNTYSFQTYIHEIGHALGLGHAGQYNGSADYNSDAEYLNDSWQTSIMSYFRQDENPNTDASRAYVVTPMVADIMAVQELYGTAGTLRTGDTTYGNNSTAGGYYDQLGDLRNVAFTIIDDGGTDTLDTSSYSGSQTIRMGAETFSDIFGETGNLNLTRGTILENVEGGSGRDTVFGNDANNRIDGNAGNDVIRAGNGTDILRGGSGEDLLAGDAGFDTLYGGTGDDTLEGGLGHDHLVGDAGNDALYGGSGHDILKGRSGDNLLDGGDGNDTIFGANAGADNITGGTGADRLLGLGGNDVIDGNAGKDNLLGGQGNDTVDGGYDDDLLYGNRGEDQLSGGHGLDRLFGGLDADSLLGGDGRDTLFGEDGDDFLNGERGSDVLNGGEGADIFYYGAGGQGYDRVRDFESGVDLVDLSEHGFNDLSDVRLSDVSFGARLSFGNGNILVLDGIDAATLENSDFLF